MLAIVPVSNRVYSVFFVFFKKSSYVNCTLMFPEITVILGLK